MNSEKMPKLCWSLHKTSILAFILIIINEPTFGPQLNPFVSAYQQFFRVRPNDQEVIEDSEVLLQCQVANQAGLVQWSKDGFALGFDPLVPGWPRYTMIVDRQRGVYNLKITNVQLIDEGDIECQVGPAKENKAIRANARITVLVPPHQLLVLPTNRALVSNITKQKLSQTNSRLEVREAERITLSCNTTTPSKPQTHIKWFRNGIPLNKESYSNALREGLGASGKLSATSSTVYIYTKLDDNGVQYSCQGEHPALSKPIKSTVTLSVLYPPGMPSIEGYADGDVISVTDTLTLACISRGGNPLAKLIWYKDSQEVDNTYSSSGGRESTNIYSFTVRPSDNNALYKCEATNDVTTQPLIAFIKLKVFFPAVRVEIIGPKQGKVGDVIMLTCVAGPANPSTDISWNIDGQTVIPLNTWTVETKEGWITSTNTTITLTSQDPDTRTVSCYAVSESLGETIIQTFNIDILYPPGVPYIISGYPEGTNLVAGELYRFKCVSMGGNPLPSLRWQVLNSGHDIGLDREISALTSISGSGVSSELVIRGEPADNGATYKCEASNAAIFRPLNASIKLSVYYMTNSVNIQLLPKNPKAGDILTLTCDSGACNPMCDLFWYKNDNEIEGQYEGVIETNTPFGGKTTRNRLKLNITTKDDKSIIECKAVNQVLSKTTGANVTLSVFFKPEFLSPPLQKYDVIEGTDISVNLSARGNPSLISYIWWKDSLPLLDISDITTTMSNAIISHPSHRRQHQLTSRGSVLQIKNVFKEDAGEYDCEASNSEGSTRTSLLINVLFGPIIVDKSKTVLTESGESAQLFCLTVGNPMTNDMIEWRREGSTNFIKDNRIDVQIERGKSVLWISNVSADTDSGEYECRANNGIGEETVERVELLIKRKPEMVLNMTTVNIAAEPSETVKMVCTATGVPKVDFQWLGPQNEYLSTESELLVNNNVKYFRYNLERMQISGTVFQSALTIKRITDGELNKSFKCIAINEKGETQTVIKLRKRGKPDPPSDVKIINITQNSVFLGWAQGFDGGLKQSFRIKYHRVGQNNYLSEESDKNWILIKGLEKDSEYSFTVFAFNGLGENDWIYANHSILVSTYVTDMDSSEALIDGSNTQKSSNAIKKSFSVIIIIIVFILGLIIIALNASLVICYIKWKKRVKNNNKNQINGNKVKTVFKDPINGEPILVKGFSEEDVDLTTALMPTTDQSQYKHCEVLLMTDIHTSSSSTLSQPVTHVLLRNCQNSNKTKALSLEATNCPDIIKNPNIENYETDDSNDTNFGTLKAKQINNYCNTNNTCDSVLYSPNNTIQVQNADKFQLKSILKNGSLKSKPKHDIHML